jgi:hypothetical protein
LESDMALFPHMNNKYLLKSLETDFRPAMINNWFKAHVFVLNRK